MERNEEDFIRQSSALWHDFSRRTEDFRTRCRRNDEIWRGTHMQSLSAEEGAPRPVTPVLFSTVEAMLSDLMDYYPEPVLLGEEPGDDGLADELTQVVRYILSRRGYRKAYREKCRQALKYGASVQEVYWDRDLLGGLGDIGVRAWDVRRFVWDPAFRNLQDGRACFKVDYYPRSWIEARYPKAAGKLSKQERYANDDEVMLLECWHKSSENGETRVHMARFCEGVLLEDTRRAHPKGLYTHGLYPFLLEPLYPLEAEAAGLGMVDVLGDLQLYADRMDQIIMGNALMSGKLKLLVNKNADMDEDALTDWSREVVRGGRIDESALRWFQAQPVSPLVYAHQQRKLESIKDVSGQSTFNRGEAGQGVTAASAIIALQEAGNKRSRTLVEQMYDGFADLTRLIIAMVGQFYTEERVLRVRGEAGDRLVRFSADSLKRGEGLAELDVQVQVQKQIPYRAMMQNEMAMQLLKAGIIDGPSALDMMAFDGRDRLISRLKEGKKEEV